MRHLIHVLLDFGVCVFFELLLLLLVIFNVIVDADFTRDYWAWLLDWWRTFQGFEIGENLEAPFSCHNFLRGLNFKFLTANLVNLSLSRYFKTFFESKFPFLEFLSNFESEEFLQKPALGMHVG